MRCLASPAVPIHSHHSKHLFYTPSASQVFSELNFIDDSVEFSGWIDLIKVVTCHDDDLLLSLEIGV